MQHSDDMPLFSLHADISEENTSTPIPPPSSPERVRRLLEKAGVLSKEEQVEDPFERIRKILVGSGYKSEEQRFFEDGTAMALEASAPCAPVGLYAYFPTYEQLTPDQKAFYCYWRGCLRHGEAKPATAGYMMLYLQELIHLIGCDNPHQAIDQILLLLMLSDDENLQQKILVSLRDLYWLYLPNEDYITALLDAHPTASAVLWAEALLHPQDMRFDLIVTLGRISSWRGAKGAFANSVHRPLLQGALHALFCDLNTRWPDGFLRHQLEGETGYYPFMGLTYYAEVFPKNTKQWQNAYCPERQFRLSGKKLVLNLPAEPPAVWGRELSETVQYLEYLLRRHCRFHPIKPPVLPPDRIEMVEASLHRFLKEEEHKKQLANRRVFDVNIDQLAVDRLGTQVIRDRLIDLLQADQEPEKSMPVEETTSLFDAQEADQDCVDRGILMLLQHEVPVNEMQQMANEAGQMLLPFVEAINLRLYDLLGDQAVFETINGFAIYPEYIETVRKAYNA